MYVPYVYSQHHLHFVSTETNRIIHGRRQNGGKINVNDTRTQFTRQKKRERNEKKFEKDIEPFRLPFFVNKKTCFVFFSVSKLTEIRLKPQWCEYINIFIVFQNNNFFFNF